MAGARSRRKSRNPEVTSEGEAGKGFLVFWDGYGGRPGGRKIPWGNMFMDGAAGKEWYASTRRTSDGSKTGWSGFNK